MSTMTIGRPVKIAAAVLAMMTLLPLLPLYHAGAYSRSLFLAAADASRRTEIPNFVHYVYVLEDPEEPLRFSFSQYLSMYAASHYWHPSALYLHTNAAEESLAAARNGSMGKWTRSILSLPRLQVLHVDAPQETDNGRALECMEHKSDFVRVQAVRDMGGVYVDFDAYPLRDIAPLRRSGFRAIVGRQLGGEVNSGIFMATRRSRVMDDWAVGMHQVYDGGWTTHSNGVVTLVSERLVNEPGQVLILEREATAPGSWFGDDVEALFGVHDETEPNLAHFARGDVMPLHAPQRPLTRWQRSESESESELPSWTTDWSSTYVLHAFSPRFSGRDVTGFTDITPRYVMDRQSNFARALYPVARIMYDKGLIMFDDL